MWSHKKQKRLTDALLRTRSYLSSNKYQYRFLSRYRSPRPSMKISSRTGRVMPNHWQPRTLQNEINILKRKVGRNTPAPVFFKPVLNAADLTADQMRVDQYNLTALTLAETDFRDNINGDEWYNNWVKMRFMLYPKLNYMRVIVYTPLKTGNGFSPANDLQGHTIIPDPAAFNVIRDVTFKFLT